jgi:hypothetical protein
MLSEHKFNVRFSKFLSRTFVDSLFMRKYTVFTTYWQVFAFKFFFLTFSRLKWKEKKWWPPFWPGSSKEDGSYHAHLLPPCTVPAILMVFFNTLSLLDFNFVLFIRDDGCSMYVILFIRDDGCSMYVILFIRDDGCCMYVICWLEDFFTYTQSCRMRRQNYPTSTSMSFSSSRKPLTEIEEWVDTGKKTSTRLSTRST